MTDQKVLELPFPIMRYDITMPLLEGRANIEGVRFQPTNVSSMIFNDRSPLKEGDFGLCDLNLGYLLPAIEAGWELKALPIFPKRKPVYQLIFCRSDAGIASPKDLEGKRIGSSRYRTAITVWCRGLLKEQYGVDVSTIKWVVTGPEVFPVNDEHAEIEYVNVTDKKNNVVDLLLDGEVDALITDISDAGLFDILENNPQVKRLFSDYKEEDFQLYRKTGIFTPMHIIVMSKKLDGEYPDLAGRVFEAFEKAKQLAYSDILNDRSGFSTVYLRENLTAQMKQWGEPWKYGIKANQNTIDTLIRFNYEQGITKQKMNYHDIFANSTLET